MNTWPRFRTIIRQPRYELESKALFGGVRRADEAIRGLEWVICRRPEWGLAVRDRTPDFASWVSHTDELSAQVLYRYTASAVIFLSIRQIPSPSNSDYQ